MKSKKSAAAAASTKKTPKRRLGRKPKVEVEYEIETDVQTERI